MGLGLSCCVDHNDFDELSRCKSFTCHTEIIFPSCLSVQADLDTKILQLQTEKHSWIEKEVI